MSSMNKVMLMGNLGRDPELLFADSERPCLKMSLATSEKWRDKDQNEKERTEWHSVELWGPRAKALNELLAKGSRIYVEGSIQSRTVETNGVKRKFTDIRARDLEILTVRGEKSRAPANTVEEAAAM